MLKELYEKEDGVITIEASLVIPIILTFILFLMAMVQIVIAEMALQESVSEGAQTTAYYGFLVQKTEGLIENETDALIGVVEEKAGEVVSDQNAIFNTIINITADKGKGAMSNLINSTSVSAQQSLTNQLVKEMYAERVGNGGFFNSESIVVETTIQDNEIVEVVAEVPLEINLPFFNKSLNIKKKAAEYVWNGA